MDTALRRSPKLSVVGLLAVLVVGCVILPGLRLVDKEVPVTWQRTLGETADEYAGQAIQTRDGGYLIGASSASLGAHGSVKCLLKLSTDGDLIWGKVLEGSRGEGLYVQQTDDDGYIVAGDCVSDGEGADVFLAKTDANGDTIWRKTFGGTEGESVRALQLTGDGGYILAGFSYSFGAGSGDVWLVRTDPDGEILWHKTFGGPAFDYASTLEVTEDGGFIMAGQTHSFGAGESDIYLVRADAAGNLLWQKTFGGEKVEHASAVQQTVDGGFAVAGRTHSFGAGESDIYLLKTDTDGALLWEKVFGEERYEWVSAMQCTPDGGLILAGLTDSFGAGVSDVYLVKTDADGTVLWDKTIGGSHNERAGTALQTSDGGYLVAGWTFSFSAGERDLYIIKTDEEGSSPGPPQRIDVGLLQESRVDHTSHTSLAPPAALETRRSRREDSPTNYEAAASEREKAGREKDLHIISAKYGARGKWIDVTAPLKKRVKDGVLVVRASNDLAGDPIDGIKKELKVEYQLGGTAYSTTVREGAVLRIPDRPDASVQPGAGVGISPPGTHALRFDGRDDFVRVPPAESLDIKGDITVSAWVRVAEGAQGRLTTIAWRGDTRSGKDPFSLYTQSGRMHFAVLTTEHHNAAKSESLLDTAWHFWTGVANWQERKLHLFRDGSLEAEASIVGSLTYDTANMWNMIGAVDRGTWGRFGGSIAEVRIWNVARSPEDIRRDVGRTLTGKEPGLVAYWNFEEGSDQTIQDRSGNGHNTTLGSSAEEDANDPTWVAVETAIAPRPKTQDNIAARPVESIPAVKDLPGTLVFQGQYIHRSRGSDRGTGSLWVKEQENGAISVLSQLPFFRETALAVGDAGHRPVYYAASREAQGRYPAFEARLDFHESKAVQIRHWGDEHDDKEFPIEPGVLFDLNSRPDPYAVVNILVRRFALEPGQSKEFTMCDWGNSEHGQGTFPSYRVRVEHKGKETITVPAGTFEANHLVLTQLTSADTWFKKRAGHITEFWVLDNDVIVRILRHREPYEILLADYESPQPLPGLTDRATVESARGRLEIIHAEYGTRDTWIDLTEHLRKRVQNDSLFLKDFHLIAGDPLYGVVKELTVMYRLDGEPQYTVVRNGDVLQIPDTAAKARTPSISGRIVDTDGNPIEGVRIRASAGQLGTETVSGRDGSYQLTDVQGGPEYRLEVRPEGYYGGHMEVFVPDEGEVKGKDFTLGLGTHVTGRLVEANQRSVPDARLYIFPALGKKGAAQIGQMTLSMQWTKTDDDGRFELKHVGPGTYSVQFYWQRTNGAGHLYLDAEQFWLTVDPDQTTMDVDVVIPAFEAKAIEGHVRDSEGKGIAGVNVSAMGWRDYSRSSTRTDDSGHYRIEGIAGNTAEAMWFRHESYSDTELKSIPVGTADADTVMR